MYQLTLPGGLVDTFDNVCWRTHQRFNTWPRISSLHQKCVQRVDVLSNTPLVSHSYIVSLQWWFMQKPYQLTLPSPTWEIIQCLKSNINSLVFAAFNNRLWALHHRTTSEICSLYSLSSLFEIKPVSRRSGLFCATFDCSNNKSLQKARDFFRFQKEKIYFRFWLFIKKDERSGGHKAYRIKSTIPDVSATIN